MRGLIVLSLALCAIAAPAAAQTAQPACNRALQAVPTPQMREARSAARQACAADMATYCSGVEPGCGRPMQCLRAHMPQLSSVCADALQQLHAASAGTPP